MSITMIGLDTAKSVSQIHAVDQAGKAESKRKLRRSCRATPGNGPSAFSVQASPAACL